MCVGVDVPLSLLTCRVKSKIKGILKIYFLSLKDTGSSGDRAPSFVFRMS